MNRNTSRTFLSQTLFQFFAKLVSVSTHFAFLLLIARFLGTEVFGEFSLIHSILSTVVVGCIIGLPLTGQRFVSRSSGDPSRQFTFVKLILRNYAFLFLLTGGLLFFGLNWLSDFFDSASLAEYPWLIVGILFVFGAWKIFEGIVKGYKKIQVNALQSIVLGIGKLGTFGLLYTLLEPTLRVALVSFFSGYVLVDLIYLVIVFNPQKTRPREDSDRKPRTNTKSTLWKFSLTIFLTNVVAVILAQTDRLMIGYFLDEQSVGFYSAAFHWATLLLVLMKVVRPITGSLLSEFQSQDDTEAIVQLYFTVLKFSFVFSFPLFVCYWLYPTWFLGLFGLDFLVAKPVFQFLSITKLVQLMVGPVGIGLVMTELQHWDFYTNVCLAGMNFILNLWFIPLWGITGAALATVISWTVLLVLKFILFAIQKNFFHHVTIPEFISPFPVMFVFPLCWFGKQSLFPDPNLINVIVMLLFSGLVCGAWGYYISTSEQRAELVHFLSNPVIQSNG